MRSTERDLPYLPSWASDTSMNDTAPPEGATWIYAVVDTDWMIRYIGKTISTPNERLNSHLRYAKNPKNRAAFANWLRKINYVPTIHILGLFKPDLWEIGERSWIAHLRETPGNKLLNIAPGGEGHAGWKHSEESLRKIREASTGKKQSPESIKKRIETQRRLGSLARGPETRKKIGQANRKPWSAERRVTMAIRDKFCACGAGPYSSRGMGNHHRRCNE